MSHEKQEQQGYHEGSAAQSGYVDVYADSPADGYGPGLRFSDGSSDLRDWSLPADSDDGTWNDDITTIYLPPGQTATFYEDIHFNDGTDGELMTLSGGDGGAWYDLAGYWWNDEISSIGLGSA